MRRGGGSGGSSPLPLASALGPRRQRRGFDRERREAGLLRSNNPPAMKTNLFWVEAEEQKKKSEGERRERKKRAPRRRGQSPHSFLRR